MSQKFSFVVEVKNGKPVGHAFKKEDAQSAKELFSKLRDEGKEAYLYQHPTHDKRCKSAEQTEASKGTESEAAQPVADDMEVIEKPKKEAKKGNSILGF